MTLEKGFLRPNIFFPSRLRIILFLIISLLIGILFYIFLYSFREIIHGFIFLVNAPWDRTDNELWLANLFLAILSLLGSSAIFFSLLLRFNRQNLNVRRRGSILINQSVLFLVFISLIIRYTLIESLFLHPALSNQDVVATTRKLVNWIFVGSLIVLFFNSWVEIIRIYKKRAYRWMLYHSLVISITAIGLSLIQLVPEDYFKNKLENHNPVFNYQLALPTQIFENGWIPFPQHSRIHVVYENSDKYKKHPKVLLGDVLGSISDISDYFVITCNNGLPNTSSQRYPVVGIDKNVPMRQVDSIKSELSSVYIIAYFLVNDASNTYADYNSSAAIPINLLDEYYKKNGIVYKGVPRPPFLDSIPLPSEHSIFIDIDAHEQIKLNNQIILLPNLITQIRLLLQSKKTNVFILSISSESRFEAYANCLGSIYQARKLAQEGYNRTNAVKEKNVTLQVRILEK